MADTPRLTPQQRVRMFVSGHFTSAALGPLFQEVLNAIDADPAAHLRAFEQLFVRRPASRLALTDLHLDSFLQRISRRLPREAQTVARTLLGRMASLARAQAGELSEADDEATAAEVGRQQRELAARRDVLAQIAR